MRQGRRPGFTLIELLLVITIIVLLMSLLIPAVGSAVRAVKIANAERAVLTLHQAIVDYHKAFGAYPPDGSPDKNMDTSRDGGYVPYRYPDGQEDGKLGPTPCPPPIFNDGNWNGRCYGGKFLVYFLMGPYGTGWHRPTTTATTDLNYRHRFITAEWNPPPALSTILVNRPVFQGPPAGVSNTPPYNYTGFPFPVFADGFGLEGYSGGAIGYIRANAFSATSASGDKWTEHNGPLGAAFYWDCRGDVYFPGDGQPVAQQEKMLAQCPHDFAVISPGPDRKFGYRSAVILFNGVYRKGSWSNLETGLIDDIANFPLK